MQSRFRCLASAFSCPVTNIGVIRNSLWAEGNFVLMPPFFMLFPLRPVVFSQRAVVATSKGRSGDVKGP